MNLVEFTEEHGLVEPENADQNVRSLLADRNRACHIVETSFDYRSAWYDIETQGNGLFRVCAQCGETQPMSLKALEAVGIIPSEELESTPTEELLQKYGADWNNNPCETRHPPFRVEM